MTASTGKQQETRAFFRAKFDAIAALVDTDLTWEEIAAECAVHVNTAKRIYRSGCAERGIECESRLRICSLYPVNKRERNRRIVKAYLDGVAYKHIQERFDISISALKAIVIRYKRSIGIAPVSRQIPLVDEYRERILDLRDRMYSRRQIAAKLGVSLWTVERCLREELAALRLANQSRV